MFCRLGNDFVGIKKVETRQAGGSAANSICFEPVEGSSDPEPACPEPVEWVEWVEWELS